MGSGYGDFEDVKSHVFFKNINWDDLINKKIKPPFNPHVEGEYIFCNRFRYYTFVEIVCPLGHLKSEEFPSQIIVVGNFSVFNASIFINTILTYTQEKRNKNGN